MMTSFEKTSEDSIYLLRTMEDEEMAQEQWIDKKKEDKRLWCLIISVLGTNVLYDESEVN